ncbi:NUDIX hydrolase [Desulfonema magnum]|uniref:NUDIX hydrolase n=1 Tax=Desulfonema magnum TaxID=45655 RepID=UPI001A9AFC49|nr:CoA pyrophosphatase [Desulfonema magnum]
MFSPSAVLLLLGQQCGENKTSSEPCLILNKRSRKVRQPGDLCCPGGSVSPRLDACLSTLLTLPGFPLMRWPCWSQWRDRYPDEARMLKLLFATGLRECFEEMRLNPFGVQLMGPLPPRRLLMFRRVIFPMAAWIPRQKRFAVNWEVEKVVYIPLRYLLNPDSHACYRVQFTPYIERKLHRKTQDFPCIVYKNQNENELLWGATYHIVIGFLEMIFGFKPPDMASLSVIHGVMEENYLTGSG